MRTALLTAATIAATLLPITTTAPAATADTRPCVTSREYHRVHQGHTTRTVHQVFDTRGTLRSIPALGYRVWTYPVCNPRSGGHVRVTYKHYHGAFRLIHKRA